MRRGDDYGAGNKVYIGPYLDRSVTAEELRDLFSKFGTILTVWVARNPPGFAFVTFEDPKDAADACRALDGSEFAGKKIRVEVAHGPRGNRTSMTGGPNRYAPMRARSRSFSPQYRNSPGPEMRHRRRSPSYGRGSPTGPGSGTDPINSMAPTAAPPPQQPLALSSYSRNNAPDGARYGSPGVRRGRSPSRRSTSSDSDSTLRRRRCLDRAGTAGLRSRLQSRSNSSSNREEAPRRGMAPPPRPRRRSLSTSSRDSLRTSPRNRRSNCAAYSEDEDDDVAPATRRRSSIRGYRAAVPRHRSRSRSSRSSSDRSNSKVNSSSRAKYRAERRRGSYSSSRSSSRSSHRSDDGRIRGRTAPLRSP